MGIAALILETLMQSAAAASASPAPPLQYDCDANPGGTSAVSHVQAGPSYRVRGRITALGLRKHPRAYPVGTVGVVAADGNNAILLTLERRDRMDNVELVLKRMENGRSTVSKVATWALNRPAPFEIEVGPGAATVRAGGKSYSLAPAMGNGAAVRLSCSTGEFRFDQVDWGATAAP